MTLWVVWTIGAVASAISFHRVLVKAEADVHTPHGTVTYAVMVIFWPVIIGVFLLKVLLSYVRRKK